MRPRTAKVELDSYPRPPRGGRPAGHRRPTPHREFLSTPSARRATQCRTGLHDRARISIHALREEGDLCKMQEQAVISVFLSTPSARRATTPFGASSDGLFQFLSTPSVRRATVDGPVSVQLVEFLSTPSVRRATVPKFSRLFWICYFYPRPPRGGRPKNPFRNNKSTHFCPRPPRGGRRRRRCRPQSWIYFYPRPPRGGRQAIKVTSGYRCVFLSTPSARRATRPALCL